MSTFVRIPKNVFHFNNQFVYQQKKITFHCFQSPCEHEDGGGLDQILSVECRPENIPERLIGRSCAPRHVFTFVSFAQAVAAPPRKWSSLCF
jgi:hypothetical protein